MCIHNTTAIAAVTKPLEAKKPYSCAQPENWLRKLVQPDYQKIGCSETKLGLEAGHESAGSSSRQAFIDRDRKSVV